MCCWRSASKSQVKIPAPEFGVKLLFSLKNGMATSVAEQQPSPITLRFPNPNKKRPVADQSSSSITLRFPNPNKKQATVQKPKKIKSTRPVLETAAKAAVSNHGDAATTKGPDTHGNTTLCWYDILEVCRILCAECFIWALFCDL